MNNVNPPVGPHEMPNPRGIPGSGLRGRGGRITLPTLAAAIAIAGCGLLVHRDLPARMIGMPQTFSSDGGALADVRRLRGLSGDARSGAFAIYGGGVVSLWVANEQDTAAAEGLIRDITTRIGRGDTPFAPESLRTVGKREVHAATGMGQRHFYFRSGRRVVWLAANRRQADAALDETVVFYR